jgi:hypothetical protein
MPVIALTKELGSLDKDIADQVSQALGLRSDYAAVLDDIRNQSLCAAGTVSRIVEGRAGRFERWRSQATRFNAYAKRGLLAQACAGDVLIRGWASPLLFAPVPQILKVRISAPLERRVENLRAILNTDDEALIRAEIRRSDFAFATTLRTSIRPASDMSGAVDLALDTGTHSVAKCVDQIVRLAGIAGGRETAGSARALRKMAVLAHVRAELEKFGEDRRIQVEVSDGGDVVGLSGMVSDRRAIFAICDAVAAIAGVVDIRSTLRPIYGNQRAGGMSNF